MPEIIIDQEFKLLLPALDAVTYAWLEENILEHGCMQPLVLWNGILIDGHNRYAIVQKHGLPFNTVSMEFDSRDDVIIWIISTQISRRNLTQKQLTFFRGLHYNTEKKIHGGGERFVENVENSPIRHSDGQPDLRFTANRLAREYNVSPRTIERDAVVAEAISAIGRVSPEAKRDILAERVPITRKELRALLSGSEGDITDVATSIENGTFEEERAAARAAVQENPVELILSGIRTLNAAINRVSDDLPSELQSIAGSSDKTELKTALRSHIDMLEDLYRLM
ncbi:MAG: hypothetical protein FWD00_04535 [Clostridiales bacterium]|nr:hypothetical protein [Clostridiales bacterium]